ncbi:MAG: gene transfer agent family protein [Synergistaceae bacterium]|nr:gene transfer agent family protein [Synergistaceae bacterium]
MKIIRIGNKDYEIHYGQNALCAIEDAADMTILDFGARFASTTFRFGDARILVWAGMLAKRRSITLEEVGDLLDDGRENAGEAIAACITELTASFRRIVGNTADEDEGSSKNE